MQSGKCFLRCSNFSLRLVCVALAEAELKRVSESLSFYQNVSTDKELRDASTSAEESRKFVERTIHARGSIQSQDNRRGELELAQDRCLG